MLKENILNNLNAQIRRHYDQNTGKWFFSVVDIIDIVTDSSDPRNYWKVLKNRLNKTHNQLVTSCNQLKMESKDGKFYLTDTGDKDTILKILEIVSSDSIPVFEEYLATLNKPQSENTLSLIKLKPANKETEKGAQKNINSSYPQEENLEEEFMIMVDLYRKNNSLILEAFVAGVSLADLNITATCNTVMIKGKREIYNNIATSNYREQELSWGKFGRNISLPHEVDINKIEASDERGLITIKMPMIDKSYARKVKIKYL